MAQKLMRCPFSGIPTSGTVTDRGIGTRLQGILSCQIKCSP